MVNGKMEKPIVISIQPTALWPNAYTVNRKLDSIVARYRCDVQRLNVTGLSMGGWSWDNYVDNYSSTYTNRPASIVAMSAPEPDNSISNMKYFAQSGGKWWGFEGSDDYRKMDQIRDTLNRYAAGSARYTPYVGGHCCWNTWYDPTYMENGESIYTFMLKQRKGSNPTPPQANAGNDSTLASTASTFPLRGNGNDPVGLPISFQWTKIAGPAGNIASPTSATTSLTGLTTGEYKYELKVTNSIGAVGRDTITIDNGNVVLPVKLISFNATPVNNSKVVLQWKTETENNSSHFIVERSRDSMNFASIVSVNATGRNGGGSSYNIADNAPANGVNYYRLKMVDRDGSFEYSRVIAANVNGTKQPPVMIASAKVSGGTLQVYVTSNTTQSLTLVVTDLSGKNLLVTPVGLQEGATQLSLPLNVAGGIYYVRLIGPAEVSNTKSFLRE